MSWADLRSEVEDEFGALRERQRVELFGAYERMVARRNAPGAPYHTLTRAQKKRYALATWSRRVRKRLSARAAIRCHNPRCEAVFVPWHASTKYCSDACKHRVNSSRHRRALRSKQLASRAARICRGCGKSFMPWRTNVFSCSERCGYLANCKQKRHERQAHLRPRRCAFCGDAFMPARSTATHCSKACTLATERAQSRERARRRRRSV